MSRNLRISFLVSTANAGGILADLAGAVSQLDFHVEETPDPASNGRLLGPLAGKSSKRLSGGGSAIPELFRGRITKDREYTYQEVRKIISEAGYSANGYSNALMRLKKAGLLGDTKIRGVYVGLVNHV